MKNSLMLWTLSVLLLSVIIECKNKTEEEKPKQGFLQDVDNSTATNSTSNQTEVNEELHPKGNLGEAKEIKQNRMGGNRDKSKNNKYPKKGQRRNQGPSARTELPAARTEGPHARTELPAARTEGPAARNEVEGPAARVELPSARVEVPIKGKKRLSEARKRNN